MSDNSFPVAAGGVPQDPNATALVDPATTAPAQTVAQAADEAIPELGGDDGNRIGEVSNAVMKDRKIMANDGIVVVIANIDIQNNQLLSNPNIITRGFVLVNDNLDLLKKLELMARDAINSKIKTGINYTDVKTEIINTLSNYINFHTGRKPIILPVIMNIKKDVKLNS